MLHSLLQLVRQPIKRLALANIKQLWSHTIQLSFTNDNNYCSFFSQGNGDNLLFKSLMFLYFLPLEFTLPQQTSKFTNSFFHLLVFKFFVLQLTSIESEMRLQMELKTTSKAMSYLSLIPRKSLNVKSSMFTRTKKNAINNHSFSTKHIWKDW